MKIAFPITLIAGITALFATVIIQAETIGLYRDVAASRRTAAVTTTASPSPKPHEHVSGSVTCAGPNGSCTETIDPDDPLKLCHRHAVGKFLAIIIATGGTYVACENADFKWDDAHNRWQFISHLEIEPQ